MWISATNKMVKYCALRIDVLLSCLVYCFVTYFSAFLLNRHIHSMEGLVCRDWLVRIFLWFLWNYVMNNELRNNHHSTLHINKNIWILSAYAVLYKVQFKSVVSLADLFFRNDYLSRMERIKNITDMKWIKESEEKNWMWMEFSKFLQHWIRRFF